jgi:hypothetical protein
VQFPIGDYIRYLAHPRNSSLLAVRVEIYHKNTKSD